MRILFIHNNFPGQYRRIVQQLVGKPGYEMLAASLADNQQVTPIKRLGYARHREPHPNVHPALRYTEWSLLNGQAAIKSLLPVYRKGWKPDIMLAHSGWGPGMFLKDLWPDARYLAYFEWYYQSEPGPDRDVGFLDDGQPLDFNERIKIRMKNTTMLQDFAAMDWGQCPTEFQASQFPEFFRSRMSILHDGVDTQFFSPADDTVLQIGDHQFRKGDPLVTYIARGMEPYRGFPQWMEAVARLQKVNSSVHALIIGQDRVAYGRRRKDGRSYREVALEEHDLDLSRIHFVGNKPLPFLRDALRVSAAHVYLTIPFVLSWSMLEAMSTGALIVGSDTGPVREVIEDGKNGFLVPFFEPARLADKLQEILENKGGWDAQRQAARQSVLERYDVQHMGARYLDLIHTVADGRTPQDAQPAIG